MSEPGPKDHPRAGVQAIPSEGRGPRRPAPRGGSLLTFLPAVGGPVLVVVALLVGLLPPVGKGCKAAFVEQSGVSRICRETAISMTFLWLAVLTVGVAATIFALIRTYRLLQVQGADGPEADQSAASTIPRREPMMLAAGEDAEHWKAHQVLPSSEDSRHPTSRGPQRWPYVVAIVVLAAGALGLGAGYAYSNRSADQWRSTADNTSRDLAAMVAERDDLVKENAVLSSQINDTTTQLTAANARIRSLANEKAQLGDNAAFLAELVVMSHNVSSEMSACISDLQRLQTYLVDAASYDAASLIAVVRDVNTQCNAARSDSDALTRKIQAQ